METFKLHNFKESSVLHAASWNNETKDLIIIFRSRAVWLYRQVPETIYENFIAATSSGQFFNVNIRDTYLSQCLYKQGETVVQT
jgi:hypothetical protein